MIIQVISTGNINTQTDGVAMGIPLGPLFGNFYMAQQDIHKLAKPTLYIRYIADIFIQTNLVNELLILKMRHKEVRGERTLRPAHVKNHQTGYQYLPSLNGICVVLITIRFLFFFFRIVELIFKGER